MNKPSKDYHDYVIRDGKLIGEFEAMYQHSEGVPWHQDEQEKWVDVRLTIEMLRDLPPFAEIHDLSCGLGYYLDLLRKAVGAPAARGVGYDISPTACEKARTLFPEYSFHEFDMTSSTQVARNGEKTQRALFVNRGTLWYVFPKMAAVVENTRALMKPGDLLLVAHNWPPLDTSFVGKDVLPDHFALMRHFAAHFVPVRHIWYQDTFKTANDNWFLGLFSPR
jgi:SAM-dependent methyltransferase